MKTENPKSDLVQEFGQIRYVASAREHGRQFAIDLLIGSLAAIALRYALFMWS